MGRRVSSKPGAGRRGTSGEERGTSVGWKFSEVGMGSFLMVGIVQERQHAWACKEASMHYRDAVIWDKAMALAEQACRLAGTLPAAERFGLRSQLSRAA